MLLSEIVLIGKSISKEREDIHYLAKSKGSHHPEVLKAKQQLDKKIVTLQQKYFK